MAVRKLIKTLLDIEVNTDDLDELRSNPEACVGSKADAQKLRELFLLIEMTADKGVDPDAGVR
jgi:hypothetical protein